jgi:hypothetical protein
MCLVSFCKLQFMGTRGVVVQQRLLCIAVVESGVLAF